MKLLLDENLSPRLPRLLADLPAECVHVHQAGLGGADDGLVWDYAKAHRFAIVSKDSDFVQRSVLDREPPKIIWLTLGNCPTQDIETLLRAAYPAIRAFIEDDSETCLMLSRA